MITDTGITDRFTDAVRGLLMIWAHLNPLGPVEIPQ